MFRSCAALVATAAIVLLPVDSAVAKPAAVKSKVAVSSAVRAGNHISPPVEVTFAPPAGVSAGKACKGKVTLTVEKPGKKPKTLATKSAQLKNVTGMCTARIAPKLKVAVIGTKLKFTAAFGGNSKVKQFTKSKRAKVTEKKAPTGFDTVLEAGDWHLISDDTSWYWYVKVGAGNTVTKLQRWNNNTLSCPGHPSVQINGAGAGGGPDPEKVKWTVLPFAVNQRDVTVSSSWASGVESATATLKIHVESASRMTGTYRLDGMFSTDGGVYACSSGDIPVTWGNGELG